MIGGDAVIGGRPRERPRDAASAAGARRKAKAKAKGESESRRRRKAKAQTDGAKVPDRNVRLPDERPRLRAHGRAARAGRLRADRRRPRRRRRRHQHLQRARARRGEALHAARRAAQMRRRAAARDPIVAVAGCVAQQEGDALLKRSPGVADVIVGTQAIRRLPMLVDEAVARGRTRRPLVDLDPLRRRVVSAGHRAARRSGEGVRHDHRGLQRVLRLLRRAVHARPRADAAGRRHPRRGPRGGRRPARREVQLLGQIVNHYQAPDDPACDFAALLEAVQRRRRASSGSGSRARIRATSRRA